MVRSPRILNVQPSRYSRTLPGTDQLSRQGIRGHRVPPFLRASSIFGFPKNSPSRAGLQPRSPGWWARLRRREAPGFLSLSHPLPLTFRPAYPDYRNGLAGFNCSAAKCRIWPCSGMLLYRTGATPWIVPVPSKIR
jgi:hypothetical protein